MSCQGKSKQVCVMIERTAAKAEMQERILQTTDRLFYEQGIRAVGVDTVAAEVGISKRTLYNYYPSKDELIDGLSGAPLPAGAVDRPAAGRADSGQFRAARALVRE